MSNVLIGIIGVILFIGLALAGALFLGPRFQEATANSKASYYANSMKQIADGVNMYRTDQGLDLTLGNVFPVIVPAYLKARPLSEIPSSGMLNSTGGTSGSPYYVYISQTDGEAVCAAFARTSGQSVTGSVAPTGAAPDATSQQGCIKLTAAFGAVASGTFLYYHRI